MGASIFSTRAGANEAAILRTLAGSKIFRALREEQRVALGVLGHLKRVGRGEVLFRAEQAAESLVLVRSGLLKLVQHTADGTEVILGIFGPRELVGLLPALRQGQHAATAVAVSEEVEVLFLPGAKLLEMAGRDTGVALVLGQALMYQAQLLHETIGVMSAGSVPQRLAALLLALAERFGDELEDGTTAVPVALTRGELSSLVNARTETTIRVLTRWRKEGMLETTKEGFVIRSMEQLREALCRKAGWDC
jgi:CRP-like cAMP-binding protein